MHHSERRARELLKRLNGAENPVGVEVGVWQGEMSHHLLRLRDDLYLYMVDDWADRRARSVAYRKSRDWIARKGSREMTQAMAQADAVTAFATDRRRLIRASSPGAADHVHDASLDFVFIDAEHTYTAVCADIAGWLPKLRPGGLMSGHDYSIPGERSQWGWPGVVRAVDEFVGREGLTLDRGEEATWFVRLP